MNDETLERLMIDDALDALTEDAGELLAEYCRLKSHEPQRLQWRQLALTAREALEPRAADTLPLFPAQKMRGFRIGGAAKAALALAAVLLFGMGIGFHLHLAPPATPLAAGRTGNPPSAATAGAVPDIWSSNRLLASALESKNESQAHWRWSSPVGRPEMEGVR